MDKEWPLHEASKTDVEGVTELTSEGTYHELWQAYRAGFNDGVDMARKLALKAVAVTGEMP